ncbi:PilN domain-containing protein [bacterium]|nr:PilN domain-containing protein [bacterium]
MEETEKKLTLSGDNRLLVGGVIYFLALALIIWLGYAWRMIVVQRQNSKIQSIKAEVYAQVDEEELSQLEGRIGKLATLYGQPVVSKLLADIEKSIPKNTVLSSIEIEKDKLIIGGITTDYRSVPLFATALKQQSALLDNVEVREANHSAENGKVIVSFILESKL